MTVKELIEALSALDPDYEVACWDRSHPGILPLIDVEAVEFDDYEWAEDLEVTYGEPTSAVLLHVAD